MFQIYKVLNETFYTFISHVASVGSFLYKLNKMGILKAFS